MKHLKLFENFGELNEETIKGPRGLSANIQHDYLTLKMPVGNYTAGRYGAKASGQLVTMKGAFEAIDKYVEDAVKNDKKTYGDVFKELVSKPEILDKLVPGWDKPKEVIIAKGDTVKMSEPAFAKKYPAEYEVIDVRKTNVFIKVPKKGSTTEFENIGFPKYALEPVKTEKK